jgi:hypothetical protein
MQDFWDERSSKVAIIAFPAGGKLKEFGIHGRCSPFTKMAWLYEHLRYYACMLA